MKTRHIFVPLLDVEEILPFAMKKKESLKKNLDFQEGARAELVKFVDKLEKNFKENIYYMGMDLIGGKSYERFIFQKGGFLEVMMEEPLALNAHFVAHKRASKFLDSLKKTLKQVLPKDSQAKMLMENLQVQDEEDTSLSVERWNIMKDIRNVK